MRKKLIEEMMAVFGEDARRISHAFSVLEYAERIAAVEGGDLSVITAAAILHDIGIHQAEYKYNSATGNYQEIEGPPIAREILERHNFPLQAVEHICKIIANHHSAKNIDTLEFRIVWDSDWLVNIPDDFNGVESTKMRSLVEKVFKTKTGREMAGHLFLM